MESIVERFQISRRALMVISNSLEKLYLAPNISSSSLCIALAANYCVHENSIIVGNGTTEIINAIFLASNYDRESNVVISSPTFNLYSKLSCIYRFRLKTVPLKNYCHDIETIYKSTDDLTKIIFLDSPHYITGSTIPFESIIEIAKSLPEITIVLDNVYSDFQYENFSPHLNRVINEVPNLIILRSFSKAHGLLGLRIGFAIGNSEHLNRLQSFILPYSVNTLGQIAALESLNDSSNVFRNIQLNEKAKVATYKLLDKMKIKYIRSESNALLIDFGERISDAKNICVKHNIKFRDELKCGFPNHIQIHLIDMETVKPFHETLIRMYR